MRDLRLVDRLFRVESLIEYFSDEGSGEDVVITIALGSYKPVFSRRPLPQPSDSPPASRHQNEAAGAESAARCRRSKRCWSYPEA